MNKLFIVLLLIISVLLMVFIFVKKISASKNTPTLVCLGNSLTAGYGADIPGVDNREKSYPAYLQNRITIPVVNAGVSGNTTAQGLSRIRKDVLSKNPQIVIIELGGNDLLQGIPLSTTQNNLQKIISLINNGNRKIYLAKFYSKAMAKTMLAMLQITDYDEQTALIEQYDAMFNTLAAVNNVELIEDIWNGLSEKYMSDNMHPNAEGYKIMAENYFSILKPYFRENNMLK